MSCDQRIAANTPLPPLIDDEHDIYIVYTGRTTGMPKGVMYRHCHSAPGIAAGRLGGWAAGRLGADVEPAPEALLEMVGQMADDNANPIVMPACPLMHGTGMWLGAISTHLFGGTVVLLGRGSVCINTGGEKVFPEEVEEALKAHESVWDALVVGVPDERFGERVIAVVAATAGYRNDEAALKEFTRSRLAGYKMPRQFVIVDMIQRTANGKADHKWAKETALAAMI